MARPKQLNDDDLTVTLEALLHSLGYGMEWTTAASLTVRLGKQGYDHRHLIQRYWSRAKAFLDVGKTQILVTGRSNAGKTMLVAQMHGKARDLAFEPPIESRTVEVEAIPLDVWTKLVRVLPGQRGRRTQGEIDAFENNAELEAVIHVVDYGYVAPRDHVAATALVNSGISTVSDLVVYNLNDEVVALYELLANIRRAISKNKCPRRLIVAVNKVDLFPAHRDKALEFYHPAGGSNFGKALSEFIAEVGSDNFEVFVLQTCAYETDFVWNGVAVKSQLAPREHESILKEFMKSVASIIELPK